MRTYEDPIAPEVAGTLNGLFMERVRRTPDTVAYRQYETASRCWRDYTWTETAAEVARWQGALSAEGLERGDRVAVMMRGCRQWVLLDQAALGLGLVVVPLYVNDRADNAAYILDDAGVKLLLLEGAEQWDKFSPIRDRFSTVQRIICLQPVDDASDPRLKTVENWLKDAPLSQSEPDVDGNGLATIVYTSGTTGRPKGVMLSHSNILENAWACLRHVPDVRPDDLFLSFLPLSHTFERTCGYYLPMMVGATVAYARSIEDLAENLVSKKPTVLISVPRIYERVHAKLQAALDERPALAKWLFRAAVDVGWDVFEHRQGRGPWQISHLHWPLLERLVARPVKARLGGRLRFAISGGAPLNPEVARLFLGLGVTVLQGYGLTETSPVIAADTPGDNMPQSVGRALPGLEVRVGEDDELLVRGPSVMQGYWNRPEATAEILDPDGWLHSGDKARIEDGRIFITGRLKEIIVIATGEKIPPTDMEMAIANDPLIREQQVLVLGEGRPYLSALVVLNQEAWLEIARGKRLAEDLEQAVHDERVEQLLLERLSGHLTQFPGYAQLRRVAISSEAWTIDNALLTPTLKPRRNRIMEHYRPVVDHLYESRSTYRVATANVTAGSG